MITIKDYAKQQGVSYEAIRKQIKRYEKDLEGHLVKQNRFLMLDDDAVRFLDAKRSENPVIVYEQNKDEELEQLRKENKNLLIQMNMVQDEMKQVQQKLIAEMDHNKLLTNEKVQYLEYKTRAEEQDLQLQDIKKERDKARAESAEREEQLRQKEQQIGALTTAKETITANLEELKKEREKTNAAVSQQEALLRLKEQQIGALTTAKETSAANLAEMKKEMAAQQQKARETEAELSRLQHRGFWDRLFNR